MILARATSVPEWIKTFPRGEGAEVSALASILNQLVEKNEILQPKYLMLKQIQKLKEKNALFESILAGRDGKIVVLDTPKTVRPPTKENANQIAILDQKIVEIEANQAALEAAKPRRWLNSKLSTTKN